MVDDAPPKPPRIPPPPPRKSKRPSGETPVVKKDAPPPPPAPPSIPRPPSNPRLRPRPLAITKTAERVEAEKRGNVVAPVAGEMLVAQSDDDRPTLHKMPPPLPRDDFDDEVHTLTHRPGETAPAILEAYTEEARTALQIYTAALETEQEADRRGRLHFEIGRIAESVLGDSDLAVEHYRKALEATPSRLPVITGARRVLLARGEYAKALDLFDRELRVTADRATKAALMFAKARVLETKLGRAKEARELYTSAGDLVASDPVLLKAIEQTDWSLRDWTHLADAYAELANAIGADAKHRAALVVRRARQLEVHADDRDAAAQLYEEALDIDHGAPGAVEALKRLQSDGAGSIALASAGHVIWVEEKSGEVRALDTCACPDSDFVR